MTQQASLRLPRPDYFVLASSSPRRRQLLSAFKIPFTVLAPDTIPDTPPVNETPLPNETPAALTQRLSAAKANAVSRYLLKKNSPKPWSTDKAQHIVVVAADTVVVFQNQILGKPASAEQAIKILQQLRNKQHKVYSGLTVTRLLPNSNDNMMVATRLHCSNIWMRHYSNAEIKTYVASGSPLDKAGAYGIQDDAFAPVERLEGCFASVMGFPLGELAAALREIGLFLPQVSLFCSRQSGRLCCQSTPCGF